MSVIRGDKSFLYHVQQRLTILEKVLEGTRSLTRLGPQGLGHGQVLDNP